MPISWDVIYAFKQTLVDWKWLFWISPDSTHVGLNIVDNKYWDFREQKNCEY